MKFQYVFLGLTLMVGIKDFALATQSARGLSQSPDLYHSCRRVGDSNNIALGYFKGQGIDGRSYEYPALCQMQVTGCKEGNELTHPEGMIVTAFCDHGQCNTLTREATNCDCPTNANECVNDQAGDRRTNYSRVTRIFLTRQSQREELEHANRVAEIVNHNKRIFQQLQDGVPCDQVNGVPYGVKVTFDDGVVENIFPFDAQSIPSDPDSGSFLGQREELFDIGFIKGHCFRERTRCPSLFHRRRIDFTWNKGPSRERAMYNYWTSPNGRSYRISKMERQQVGTACSVERFKTQLGYGGRSRSGTQSNPRGGHR